jgi:hypothetical protein
MVTATASTAFIVEVAGVDTIGAVSATTAATIVTAAASTAFILGVARVYTIGAAAAATASTSEHLQQAK